MFHISSVLKRIRKRITGNIITMAGILIGTALIIFALNILFDIGRQNDELRKNAMDITYTISSRNIPREPQTLYISEGQLGELHGVADVRVNVSVSCNIITFAGRSHLENGEEITDRYIVTFSESAKEISAEKEFAEVLPYFNESNTVNFGDVDFAAISISDTFDDGAKYVHSCVIPLDMYWKIAQPSSFSEFVLTAVCEKSDSYKRIVDLKELLARSDEYEFCIGNEFYDFLAKASYAEATLSKITFFSAILLAVVFASTVCVFLCLVDERAFELAVCRASGASAAAVFLEFFAELLIISLVPAAAAVLLNALVFESGFEMAGVAVSHLNIAAALLCIAGILITDCICIIPVAVKLVCLKPYELLAAEG